jgi:hypothetical protein
MIAVHEKGGPLVAKERNVPSYPSLGDDSHEVPIDIRRMFESQLQAALDAKKVAATMISLMHEKERTEHQKKDMVRRKQNLELEKLRQSLSVRESMSDLSASIHAITERIKTHEMATTTMTLSSSSSSSVSVSAAVEDVERLKRRKERAEKKLALLVKKHESETFLEPAAQEEMQYLEEQLEDLTSKLMFQEAQLESASSSVIARDHAAGTSELITRMCHVNGYQGNVDHHVQGILRQLGIPAAAIDPALVRWLELCWTEVHNETTHTHTIYHSIEKCMRRCHDTISVFLCMLC